jgi:hypothetical protein
MQRLPLLSHVVLTAITETNNQYDVLCVRTAEVCTRIAETHLVLLRSSIGRVLPA